MFKVDELLRLGFERVEDGGTIYYQYVLNPKDYFNSSYMATDDLPKQADESSYKFEVENTILDNVNRSTLLRGEIEEIIKVAKLRYDD